MLDFGVGNRFELMGMLLGHVGKVDKTTSSRHATLWPAKRSRTQIRVNEVVFYMVWDIFHGLYTC